jgi:ribosomal protein S12 methylthiotransferase
MPAPRIGLVSLGCPKATVDSERIATALRGAGYALSPTYAGADLVVVNTCGFLDAARTESLQAIGEALAENGRVIVTGCMGQRAQDIAAIHSAVLAITGPHQPDAVLAAVRTHAPLRGRPRPAHLPPQGLKLTPPHYAYLKVAEGCNHRCTFCIIPQLRGDLVSRPIGEVLAEAEALVAGGAQELLVIAQDTSAYGADLRHAADTWRGAPLRTRFADLCRALGSLGVWVRLHYVYPYPHVDGVIPLMDGRGLLPYLDVPLQHASARILKAMRRPAGGARTLERIRRWREMRPDLTIRSTFIVGFPGETEADFTALLEFAEAAQLDRVGVFEYSPVDGAAANALPGHVADEVKAERRARLMQVQERISTARLARRVGTEIEVLVDAVDAHGALARSHADAPDIDGVVHLPGATDVRAGQHLTVRVTASDAHDLTAEPVAPAGARRVA